MLEVRTARHGDVRVRLGEADQRVLELGDQAADDPGVVAQVHPEERGDLVVAGAAGPQLAAEVGAEALQQAALQGGVARPRRRWCRRRSRRRRRLRAGPGRRSSAGARRRVSRPALWSTRACAREPAMSYGASRQSKWTDADRFASASAGPSANRAPQSRTSPLLLLTAQAPQKGWMCHRLPAAEERGGGRVTGPAHVKSRLAAISAIGITMQCAVCSVNALEGRAPPAPPTSHAQTPA